jgi:membrane associated rhomboid family serine protease
MWRSPFVPRLAVLFTLAFAILDFAAGQGLISHLVNLVGLVILAVAVWRGYSRASDRSVTQVAQQGS